MRIGLSAWQVVDVTDDQLPSTIPGLVSRAAASFAAREALVDERARITFEELAGQVERAAHALIASGIAPGDRVAIWAPNCSEWAIAALGIFTAGGVVVPLNTRFKGGEARYVLERADAKMLFTVTDFLDTNYEALLRAEPPLPELREIVDLRGPGWRDFLARATSTEKLPDTLTGDDLCSILFTSGTTGRPKGAMLTHGATVRAYDAWATVVGLRAGDRYLVVNPFFHSFGLNAGIVASLVKGATIIPHPVFDVDAVMKRAADEVLVVDENTLEVPRGEPGEVVIRGYNVMRGFIHDPEATAEVIDADGWLHTGDVAVMDERGYIRITDRTKDMFIVGGFNAYPAEIENMINEHPAVGQVAVVGVPDTRMGEVGYAYVIPRLNASVTPEAL